MHALPSHCINYHLTFLAAGSSRLLPPMALIVTT